MIAVVCGLMVGGGAVAARHLERPVARKAARRPWGEPLAPIRRSQRLLIVAPHPDDEALACGGLIQRGREAGAALAVVVLTNGDTFRFACARFARMARPTAGAYRRFGQERAKESRAVLRWLGVPESRVFLLGYPDQGLRAMERRHWAPARCYRSPSTRCRRCPYSLAWHPGRLYCGQDLTQDLAAIVRAFRPTDLFLPDPADRNPDHAAAYWYVREALLREGLWGSVRLHGYLVHWRRWPVRISHLGLHDPLLPPRGMAAPAGGWEILPLTPREIARKAVAIDRYRSETELRGYRPFLLSFARQNELFARLPARRRVPGSAALLRAAYRGRSARSAEPARG